jgi:hypothetical protein
MGLCIQMGLVFKCYIGANCSKIQNIILLSNEIVCLGLQYIFPQHKDYVIIRTYTKELELTLKSYLSNELGLHSC